MKIKTDSWHFKVMSLYIYGKYCRNDWLSMSDTERSWKDDNDLDRYTNLSFENFKRFALETGKFIPLDFCTYWRHVLLWPVICVLLWLGLAVEIIATIYAISFIGVAVVVAFIAGGAAILGAIWFVISSFDWVKKKLAQYRDNNDGFFSNVKSAMEDKTFCTLMEYENE